MANAMQWCCCGERGCGTHCTALHSRRCYIAHSAIAQHSTAQHSTAQHSTAQRQSVVTGTMLAARLNTPCLAYSHPPHQLTRRCHCHHPTHTHTHTRTLTHARPPTDTHHTIRIAPPHRTHSLTQPTTVAIPQPVPSTSHSHANHSSTPSLHHLTASQITHAHAHAHALTHPIPFTPPSLACPPPPSRRPPAHCPVCCPSVRPSVCRVVSYRASPLA